MDVNKGAYSFFSLWHRVAQPQSDEEPCHRGRKRREMSLLLMKKDVKRTSFVDLMGGRTRKKTRGERLHWACRRHKGAVKKGSACRRS